MVAVAETAAVETTTDEAEEDTHLNEEVEALNEEAVEEDFLIKRVFQAAEVVEAEAKADHLRRHPQVVQILKRKAKALLVVEAEENKFKK